MHNYKFNKTPIKYFPLSSELVINPSSLHTFFFLVLQLILKKIDFDRNILHWYLFNFFQTIIFLFFFFFFSFFFSLFLFKLLIKPPVLIKLMTNIKAGGVKSSIQFGNTRWQHPGNAPVNSICITIQFENKAYLKLYKEGCKVAPDGFSVKLILRIWFMQVLNFSTCSFKIMCKPVGNFAENFTLGKCVLPLPL